MTHLQKLAMLVSLRTAFAGEFFDVGGVAKACNLVGRPIYENTPDWHTIRALHCTDWDAFDALAKQELLEACCRVLGITMQEVADIQIPAGQPGLVATV